MGAQQSVNLSCIVDRLTHEPGENVKGTVQVKVNSEELSKFEGVTVTLAGVECMVLPGAGALIPGNRKITIAQDIVRFKDGTITKGEYEFPFSLVLPFETVTVKDKVEKQGHLNSSLPGLTHDRTDSDWSEESESSSPDDLSVSSSSQTLPYTGSKQIMYQIKASLKRKPGIPINSDTDFRCKATSAGDITVQ